VKSPFVLWLEFEQYTGGYPGPDDDPYCDFCNAILTVGDRSYGLNIWTFDYLSYARQFDDAGNPLAEPASFLVPPDLLVERLDRDVISNAIDSILQVGVPDTWKTTAAQAVDEA
jgi:hypothetical protein